LARKNRIAKKSIPYGYWQHARPRIAEMGIDIKSSAQKQLGRGSASNSELDGSPQSL
jgi:hypothetical protein